MSDVEPIIVESDDAESPWIRARRVAEKAILEDGMCLTSRMLAVLANVDTDTARHVLQRLARCYGLVKRGNVYCPPGGGGGASREHN